MASDISQFLEVREMTTLAFELPRISPRRCYLLLLIALYITNTTTDKAFCGAIFITIVQCQVQQVYIGGELSTEPAAEEGVSY